MSLFGELFFAELIEDKELLRERIIGVVADRGQLHLDDDLSVGHHHTHTSEQYLQVLRQLLPTCIPGVHCYEHSTSLHQHYGKAFIGKHESLEVLFLGIGDGSDLSSHYRQSG